MKIVMDRNYCDASLPFCSRCSAAFFRKPMGTTRPCVVDIVDDGNDQLLHFSVSICLQAFVMEGSRISFFLGRPTTSQLSSFHT